MKDETYNGWKNYETWNVVLWMGNDEGLYHRAKECVKALPTNPYGLFIRLMRDFDQTETGDGVAWNDSGIDLDAVNEAMMEF